MKTRIKYRYTQKRAGTAYTEAVIIIPFFLLVWACVYFTFDGFSARQTNLQTARECAWKHASAGCGDIPPECQGIISDAGKVNEDGKEKDVENQINATDQTVDNSGTEAPGPDNDGQSKPGWGKRLSGAVSSILDVVFGKGIKGFKETKVTAPPLLGGGTNVSTAELNSIYLVCNQRPRKALVVIIEAVCKTLSIGLLCK